MFVKLNLEVQHVLSVRRRMLEATKFVSNQTMTALLA